MTALPEAPDDPGAPTPQRVGKLARQQRIVAELGATPTLRVADLAGRLGVSTETIRRDLDDLGRRGLISRTYGGAVRPLATEPAVSERHLMMTPERAAIAVAAAEAIRPGEVVMIGAGATTVHVARRIAAACRDITVVTHAFGVATVLSLNPTITVLMCPGRYLAREGSLVGAETTEFLAGYHANHAILGATGLTEAGAMDADAGSAAVYRAMARRAARVAIVADHGKFGLPALALSASWPDVATLVTSAAPDGALAKALARAGVEVVVAAR
ncbi:DeoR/GlpR family DNA-binding transcription regulator [Methylobrevis albus]|uniref:DeoR/GlpR transcriptional regulator n=1 Tax=Methylobrevis albus TaxID=2793297 RepID=A0A931I1N0_9HYPH|nr:DeoR/GlpR family DNA-binding transcription regulator [Methylobrevis albus]MBH0237749.1 DeoR/GlpR transcriptional regulator [Methylobrevis albus]